MNKSFSDIRPDNDAYVKALYYAFGRNDGVSTLNDEIILRFLTVKPYDFADAYAKHCSENTSHLSVQDCFTQFLTGKTEFRR